MCRRVCAYAVIRCIALNPKHIIDGINGKFKIKEGSTGEPTQYLGATIAKYQVDNGSWAWSMSSDQYVKGAIDNVQAYLQKKGERLKTKTACVLPSGWKLEIDTTDLLEDMDACFYQSQIGVLRWAVELGQIDIAVEVSMLAAYSVVPRQGHLAAVFHVFAYLKQYDRSTMVFDDTEPSYDPQRFATQDWSKYHPDAKEAIPENMPEPQGYQ